MFGKSNEIIWNESFHTIFYHCPPLQQLWYRLYWNVVVLPPPGYVFLIIIMEFSFSKTVTAFFVIAWVPCSIKKKMYMKRGFFTLKPCSLKVSKWIILHHKRIIVLVLPIFSLAHNTKQLYIKKWYEFKFKNRFYVNTFIINVILIV